MKIEKGKPGYLKAQRDKLLIQTLIEFGIVIALLVIGYVQTTLNEFASYAAVVSLYRNVSLTRSKYSSLRSVFDFYKVDRLCGRTKIDFSIL